MATINHLTSTGYKAEYTATSGVYTIEGNVTTDNSKNIANISGNVSVTADSTRVGAFSVSFAVTDSSVQDAIMAAIKAVRASVDTALDSAQPE